MTSDVPAKKAAKKAAKKSPTKRARKTTTAKVESNPNKGSDTPVPPILDDLGFDEPSAEVRQVVDAVGERLTELIGEARGRGAPVLLGMCTVSLHFDVDDATTPVEAVREVMDQIMQGGLARLTWLVKDEVTDEIYGVTDGRTVSLEEARVAPE